ncbi:MAG: hypothetical protein V7731_23110 [Amphritea sp.]
MIAQLIQDCTAALCRFLVSVMLSWCLVSIALRYCWGNIKGHLKHLPKQRYCPFFAMTILMVILF